MPTHRPAAATSSRLSRLTRPGTTVLRRRPSGALVFALGLLAALALTASAEAAFPGQNGKIAFVSDRDGNAEIYVMNPDGSGQANLTNNPAWDDVAPAMSPDGQRIAFIRRPLPGSGRPGRPEIYVMNVDGSGLTNLAGDPSAFTALGFSPDGQRIAFQSSREGNSEIYTMNLDGSTLTNLTNNAASDQLPAFAPDGRRIAFVRLLGTNFEIYTMAADGSDQKNITNNPENDFMGDFSPDGKRIAFTRGPSGMPFEIYTMNSDGSGQTNITKHPASDRGPAFSPDGQRIAFASDRDHPFSEIYTMAPDGSDLARLISNVNIVDSSPAWQPVPLPQAPPDTDGGQPSGPLATAPDSSSDPPAEPPISLDPSSGQPSPSRTRIVHRTIKLRRDCSRNRLRVSGHGVQVSFVRRLPRAHCRLTLRVSSESSGRRDLLIKRGRRTIRLIAVIRL